MGMGMECAGHAVPCMHATMHMPTCMASAQPTRPSSAFHAHTHYHTLSHTPLNEMDFSEYITWSLN